MKVEPLLASVPTGIQWQITDLFRLPPGFELTFLGSQELLDLNSFVEGSNFNIPTLGFAAALKRNFRLHDGFIGDIHLLEFLSSDFSLKAYLQVAGSPGVFWDSDGLSLSKDVYRLSLLGKFILMTTKTSSEDILMRLHQQIASNLNQVRMGSPTLAQVHHEQSKVFSFGGQSIPYLPSFEMAGYGTCFIMSQDQFTRSIGPGVRLRSYNYGPLKAQRAYSKTTDEILYLQDLGGFFLVTAAMGKSLTRAQKAVLLKYFHVQK